MKTDGALTYVQYKKSTEATDESDELLKYDSSRLSTFDEVNVSRIKTVGRSSKAW